MQTYKGAIITSNGVLAWIDEEDFDRLSETSWYVERNGYVRNSRHQLLQRVVLNLPPSKPGVGGVDHINRNKIDNQKKNLRIVTASENQWNRRKCGSVEYDGRYKKPWKVRMKFYGKSKHVARFLTETEAREACDRLVREARPVRYGG